MNPQTSSKQLPQERMDHYPIPPGVHAIPTHLLDLRLDPEIDHDLLNPKSVSDDKNIWFFWHSGYLNMHPYSQRNIRAWYRRFSKQGWVIRVLDRLPSSPLNVEKFLNISDADTFPCAFVDGSIGGKYALQHTSDLVRFPLLLKYGGVYADVGMMQIGDLDHLWRETIGNPASRYEVLSYGMGGVEARALTNYFLASCRNSPFFLRCHQLHLALWNADGGKTSTEGMHRSPLLKGAPLINGGGITITNDDGMELDAEETEKRLSDYVIQGQAIKLVMGLIDSEDDWNGPKFVAEHIYAIEYLMGSQVVNELTQWNGRKAFELMSLPLPKEGETEREEQQLAREIVETSLRKSFGLKLAHGIILRLVRETLGSLWRENLGSDDVEGTYAHWLRYGTMYWSPNELPEAHDFKVIEAFKRGALLREN